MRAVNQAVVRGACCGYQVCTHAVILLSLAQEVGRLADAKAAYQEAIRLRPDFAIAHGNLASCYYDEGDMKTAIKCDFL